MTTTKPKKFVDPFLDQGKKLGGEPLLFFGGDPTKKGTGELVPGDYMKGILTGSFQGQYGTVLKFSRAEINSEEIPDDHLLAVNCSTRIQQVYDDGLFVNGEAYGIQFLGLVETKGGLMKDFNIVNLTV